MASVRNSEEDTFGAFGGRTERKGTGPPSDPMDATDTQGLAKSETDRAMACGQAC